MMDLDDLEHNTRDGVHIASLAGTWIAAVAGLGGMRDHDGALSFAPRLPQALARLTFRLAFAGRSLHVEVSHRQASYSLLDGAPLEITHHGKRAKLTSKRALVRAIPRAPAVEAPKQPPGREPVPDRAVPEPEAARDVSDPSAGRRRPAKRPRRAGA
jgi:alpha,alpha-trehalose phosphorylase